MDKRTYNICLRVARLCCTNVAMELAGVNGIRDMSVIRISVRDRDRLLSAIDGATRGKKPQALERDVTAALSVTSSVRLTHTVNVPKIFLDSAVRCGSARVAQKRLLDLFAAERYLRDAYDYDVAHRSNTAVRAARQAVAGIHSEKFLQDFVPYGRPQVDPNVRERLRRTAFDPKYSFTSEQSVHEMADKRYSSVYLSRWDYFLPNGELAAQDMPHTQAVVNGTVRRQERQLPVSLKQREPSMDMRLLKTLYNGEFANLPMNGRRRRFVNLSMRVRDLMDCPKRLLRTKQRFLEIESRTKHGYIYGYYDDGVRGDMTAKNLMDYYLQKEAEMYQLIWHTDAVVLFDGFSVRFPDGTVLEIPKGETPGDFLHRVNVIYAAMFGFTPDDMQGGDKWLEDSVRCAYTDEGMADYRLSVIAARLRGEIR